MLLDEFVEVGSQNLAGQAPRPRIDGHLVHLQQQAFAQVARPDAGRLQLVEDTQQPLQLPGRGFDADRKGDIVGNGFEVATQIAVLVDAADQIDGQPHVALRKAAETELLDQILLQRPAPGKEHGTLLVVLGVVVDAALICRGIVLAQILFDRNLLRLGLFLGRALLLFEYDVVLDLPLDALFELHGGQLQQLDHLDLLRREFLLKRKHLLLVDSHTSFEIKN